MTHKARSAWHHTEKLAAAIIITTVGMLSIATAEAKPLQSATGIFFQPHVGAFLDNEDQPLMGSILVPGSSWRKNSCLFGAAGVTESKILHVEQGVGSPNEEQEDVRSSFSNYGSCTHLVW